MRRTPILITILPLLVIGSAAPSMAGPTSEELGPCRQIRAICRDAGFAPGGASAGSGIIADCIAPIMQGTPQPRRARTPLPQVDPQLVAQCKARNPRFGQRNAPPPEPASPATRPAPLAAPARPQG
jgi:hypothetical protein